MASITSEDARKTSQVAVLNTDGTIDKVVQLQDTQVGTSTTPKSLTVTGELYLTGDLHSAIVANVFGYRLTLTSGQPVPTTDVTLGRTLYLTQHTSNMLALYDGKKWNIERPLNGEISLPATVSFGSVASTNFDVFVARSGNDIVLELVRWTSDTVRAVALARQDGVFVKSTDLTRRYVGTVRSNPSFVAEDSVVRRFVWNLYNQTERTLRTIESVDSWAYTSTTFRQSNANTANKFEYVTGDAATDVNAQACAIFTSSGATVTATPGIGIDSTSVNSAQIFGGHNAVAEGSSGYAFYQGFPGLGYHAVNWLESGNTNVTFYGDNGLPTLYQSGMFGRVKA